MPSRPPADGGGPVDVAPRALEGFLSAFRARSLPTPRAPSDRRFSMGSQCLPGALVGGEARTDAAWTGKSGALGDFLRMTHPPYMATTVRGC